MTEDEARWAARRELGNLALVEENTRAAWGWTRLEQLARDAGYGLRQVRRNPWFSAIAIATLALGIGGITAMFSAFDAVLIRPLPYADADRLVMIWDDMSRERRHDKTHSHARGVDRVAAPQYRVHRPRGQPAGRRDAVRRCANPNRFRRERRRANLWSVLGVKPLIGRVFTEDEDNKGVRVVVISHGLWQRRYGGSPGIVGPQDHDERRAVRSDRRHAARASTSCPRATSTSGCRRHSPPGCEGTSPGTTRISSRG